MNEQKIMTCPECGDTLLCTEDRGIHCDGCGFSTDDNTFILDRMREAMARLEGYACILKRLGKLWGHIDCNEVELPTYDSHDDCQRVYRTLTKREKRKAIQHLRKEIVGINDAYDFSIDEVGLLLKLTVDQFVEAILRATGGWE